VYCPSTGRQRPGWTRRRWAPCYLHGLDEALHGCVLLRLSQLAQPGLGEDVPAAEGTQRGHALFARLEGALLQVGQWAEPASVGIEQRARGRGTGGSEQSCAEHGCGPPGSKACMCVL
jgi:hypothetical protein